MKKHKFDFGIPVVSFAAATISLYLLLLLYQRISPSVWFLRSLFAGLTMTITAVMSFGAVYLYSRVRRRINVHLPKLFSVFTAVFLALIFIFSFIGQTVYSASIVPSGNVSDAKNEIVLLIDSSVSEASDRDSSSETASHIIDSLDESTALALGFFTAEVDPCWDLTPMDKNGKDEMKKHLSDAPDKGGTSLTKALNWAYDILKPDNGTDKNQTVILLTDGSSPIYPDTAKKIADAGISVNSIRSKGSEKLFLKDFLGFIKNTGGKDIESDGSSSYDQIDSLIGDYGGVPTEKKANRIGNVEFLNRYILFNYSGDESTGLTAFGFLIRAALLMFISLLFQAISFRKISLMSVAVALGGSLAADLAIALCKADYLIILVAIIVSLADYTVFAIIQPEDQRNV